MHNSLTIVHRLHLAKSGESYEETARHQHECGNLHFGHPS